MKIQEKCELDDFIDSKQILLNCILNAGRDLNSMAKNLQFTNVQQGDLIMEQRRHMLEAKESAGASYKKQYGSHMSTLPITTQT